MRAINFKTNDATFDMVHHGDEELLVWKFTLDDGKSSVTAPDKTDIDNGLYTASFDVSDMNIQDMWLLVKWGNAVEMIMVGSCDLVVWLYAKDSGQSLSFDQYKLSDGSSVKSDTMVDADDGFYYIEPETEKSVCVFDGDKAYSTLTIPYVVINVTSSGSCDAAEKNFINVGYNMFGFQGVRHSYYDTENKKWVNDDDKEAKASDLAKAVCYKYDLVWDDKDDDKWIGKYIQYIRSYDENAKKYRLYKPYKTPEDNAANFNLVQTDEDDNEWVRGVSIFLNSNIETINDVDGAIVSFREAS